MIRRLVVLFTDPKLDTEWSIIGGGVLLILVLLLFGITEVNRLAGVH